MTFSIDSFFSMPEYSAAVSGEVNASTPNVNKGARLVAKGIQNLYVMKQGSMVWDYYSPQGAPLNLTTDRVRRYRSKTPIKGGMATSINNTAADVFVYVVRKSDDNQSTWFLRFRNLTSGSLIDGNVNGGAAGSSKWHMGTIALQDTTDFNDFTLECIQSVGTAGSRVMALSVIPRRSFPADSLPPVVGGYLRGVNPIEMSLIDSDFPATPSMLRDLHTMILDVWIHRTGQILSSTRDFIWSGAPGAFTVAHRFVQNIPAGVSSAVFFFYNGDAAVNQFRVSIGPQTSTSPAVGPNDWTGVSFTFDSPRWGGDQEFQVSSVDDFEGCSAFWGDADYGLKGT
jgi:hypothetical protein